MTRFTITAPRGRMPDASFTWEDGQLSGDPDAVAMVLVLAAAYEGDWLQLPGALCSLAALPWRGLEDGSGSGYTACISHGRVRQPERQGCAGHR